MQMALPGFICEWITAFHAALLDYDKKMAPTSLNVKLMRLQQFLQALETDVRLAPDDHGVDQEEIESLKREIAEIEAALKSRLEYGSRAFLFQIPIDYGTHRSA